METQGSSPVLGSFSSPTSRSRSSSKQLVDDVTSLTSFNPFSEEDENDQSSYTLVTSLFSRMKNTLSAPLSSAVTAASTSAHPATLTNVGASEQRRPSYTLPNSQSTLSSKYPIPERSKPFPTIHPNLAPPLVSLTPAHSEFPTFHSGSPPRGAAGYSPAYDPQDGGQYGTAIPGFPVVDDARSIKTSTSHHRSGSVSKVIRRIRGEGLSKDYWMDDENCKECYDCKSLFTTWRRKHHCRICGQIFCSRCASNIIKGTRFNHDGMVRVCNLCLDKLAKVDDDDDDDRRSFVSSVHSFPAHQLGNDPFSYHPHSPFAASQIFGRTDEPFNLYSIAETKRYASRSEEDLGGVSFPALQEREDGVWEPIRDTPAPFRRALADEEKDTSDIPSHFASDSPAAGGPGTPLDFPSAAPVNPDAPVSSIQFPMGSPERGLDSPRPQSRLRTRFDSYGDFDAATPFIRSRVQSRLDAFLGEVGWRTRRESTAYAQELNLTSMLHLKIMLRQMLTTEQIPNIKEWEETLLKLALRIAKELTFTTHPHRQGEDMDVRRYVKIKKLPGGSPKDSEYVDGAVITKNVAHKKMQRSQQNPRIMLITFPLEFHRVEGQYMHFGQIVRQEKEYLGNLASRIAALLPHIVLVEKSVSRLALDALAQYNIAVARMVKPSAIRTVARMSQGDLFSSMDKLAFEPRLGHCARYRIQTFDHPLIPGRRKTLMRFEGCSRDMGCTIILRGENIETLRKIKKVTRFLTFIVRNLKLETHLWKDSVITLPAFNPEAIPNSSGEGRPALSNLTIPSMLSHPALSTPLLATPTIQLNDSGSVSEVLPHDEERDEVDEQLNLTWRIDQSLEPYKKTFISVSATLRFPPPYPIRRMKELDVQLHEAKRAWEDEIVRREEKLHSRHAAEGTVTPVTFTDAVEPNDGVVPPLNLNVTSPSNDEAATPTVAADDGYFSLPLGSGTSSVFPASAGLSALATPMFEGTAELMKTEADIALESRYTLIKLQHEEERRIWEWYLRKNSDDFVVEKYQCISLWEYTIPIAEFGLHRACFPPQLNYITFYGENDCTLGQFIEKSISDTLTEFLNPKAICTGKGCDQPLARHCKVYVHQETRLFVAVEQWDGQIIGRSNYPPSPDLITTWSVCRKCGSATPFIPVSEEMQRYSFAKFLELHFYPADVKLVLGAGCEHNIYQHHIRYFASNGMTLRFQTDPVVLHEIVYPPVRIRVRPETQLELKNKDFDRLHRRNILWYSALIDDLRLISIDAATGDEEMDEKLLAEVNVLITRAEEEREEISQLINHLYRDSPPTDTLALNPVYSFRQDKIVAWQQDFDKLPKPRPVQEKVINEKAYKKTSAFGTVRAAMWPKKPGLPLGFDNPHVPSSSVSEAEEVSPTSRRGKNKVNNFTSSASETSEIEPDTTSAESTAKIDPKEGEPMILEHPVITESPIESKHQATDPESDSTIGAAQEDAAQENTALPEKPDLNTAQTAAEIDAALPASKLPRRPLGQDHVAELVKKYSDYLPAQGVQELAKTAFPPRVIVSESEQEYPSVPPIRNTRSKSRRLLTKKPSISDFEQGYTANVAPLYLTHSRRSLGAIPHNSRIPGPIVSAFESVRSRDSSRRASPEKRSVSGKTKEVRFNQPGSPPHGRAPSGKLGKSRLTTRTNPADKPQLRSASTSTPKSALRRPVGTPGGKVSNIARHFERISRDTERSKTRYAVIRGKKARPVASARAKVEILESIKDVVQDDESEDLNSSSEADDEGEGDEDRNEHGKPSLPPVVQSTPDSEPQIEESAKTAPADTFPVPPPDPASENTAELKPPRPLTTISLPPSPFLTATKNRSVSTPPPADFDIGGTAGNSILKAISYFLPPQPVSRWALENELVNDPEHIFRDTSMVVRTDEPTSIIALALNSPQYREMLTRSRAEKRTAQQARVTEGGEVFMPDDRSVAESTSTWGVVNVDVADSADPTEDLKVPSSKLPWAITFESGGLTISCTVLYPEQFDALRRTYDCERSMVESLARCVKWNANGGKSGSAFLKTRDDRFIAKEISRPELQTMETFAPAYFDYMSSAVSANRPTLLAKVFGCYKLTFRKTSGKDSGPERSKSTQMNLLVMENLFYDRRFAKIYDLKGSTRNRHVQSTGKENEVLLDENLVETAHLAPFYLREHSKRILRGALYNDTKFLADTNVMDYSLVVGIDKESNELVVGIVDYIRTYTWDKKLESWVKESAFLGGAGKGEPTIVTPKQYRQRFITAMERYFPLIPDRWMKQKDTPEEDPNCFAELWPDW
ncbi:hypothetical protein BDN71DRAFT_13186 [Pleurotus eryngii]|uniref:1-phosphatidylinositol-3-phosphate 5-kinase n=1 Tax=Pleurotus eryngii TaxID=5323 RepID=A0A9P6AAK7_PLEER|nr:hypothetical protein BDN71DRAFT_13186 [Pleurotus eryngii]